jgi:hypothetical protein
MRVSLQIPNENVKFNTTHSGFVEIVLEEYNSPFPDNIIKALEIFDLTDDELEIVEKSISAILLARTVKSWIVIKE